MKVEVFTSHAGYLPDARKVAVVAARLLEWVRFRVISWDHLGKVVHEGFLQRVECDWGTFGTADFSAVTTPGVYQVQVEDQARSVPFVVRADVLVKTLRLAFGYFPVQRCGVAVPGYHDACHLDDAVRRDTGAARDVTGGWHDAGDVRKWMRTAVKAATYLLDFAERCQPPWRTRGHAWDDVLDEVRWENDYILRMIDPDDGLVFADVAGGINGDNSDNRMTDNLRQSGDERHINPAKPAWLQWDFVTLEARHARLWRGHDDAYAQRCAAAAERTRATMESAAAPVTHEPEGLAGAVLAYAELVRTTGERRWLAAAHRWAAELVALQASGPEHGQAALTGYFHADATRQSIFRSWCDTGVPADALAALLELDPAHAAAAGYRAALARWVEGYVAPLCARTPFAMLPFGLYTRPPVNGARLRPLDGTLGLRYFVWDEARDAADAAQPRKVFEHGQSSNLLSAAVGLLAAARVLPDELAAQARALALRQMEWVMGANPLGMCLMTGGGINSPVPFSMFSGFIPGGIMNGFVGRAEDLPYVHDDARLSEWGSTEYWNPHNAHWVRAAGMLLEGAGVVV